MSNELGAGKAVELLDRLRSTVRDFAARADKLNDDFRTRSAKEHLRRDAALEEQNRQTLAAVSGADASFQAARTAAESRYEQRKVRIGKAYQASKSLALQRVEDQLGTRKYDLQKRMLQAERDRETRLAATAANSQQFQAELAEQQADLAALEQEAHRSFSGYGGFLWQLARAHEKAQPDLSPDERKLLAELRDLLGQARGDLRRLRRFLLLRIFRFLPLWLLLALGEIPLALLLQHFGIASFTYQQAGWAAVATVFFVLLLRLVARRRAAPLPARIAGALGRAQRLSEACLQQSQAHHQQELQRLQDEYKTTSQTIDQQLKQALAQGSESRVSCRMRCDEKTVKVSARHEAIHKAKLERLAREHDETVARLQRTGATRQKALTDAGQAEEAKLNADYQAKWRELETQWRRTLEPIYAAIDATNAIAGKLFPPWNAPTWENWTPPAKFVGLARFGEVAVDVEKLSEGLPKDPRLALPGPARFPLALSLAYPDQGSILLETAEAGHDEAIGALNNIILRLLATAPPGRANFTIIDPVGLGQNFAGVMHLADYEEQIINSRIWTQSSQIEQRLADLNEHMEKVIQMYLRNEYETIAQYNEQAGVIAEKYYFLVVADFPVNFTDVAAKRLLSIASSGARCGVYTLIHWDHRQPLPQDFIPDELRKSSFGLSARGSEFFFAGKPMPGADLALDAPPPPDLATQFIHEVGRSSRDSSRVEVPFEHVVPAEAEVWTEDTTNELRVPIGRTGATKLQYLEIGKGTRQHGLIAGKTGSGKSTLFHVIITNLALWCSPEQVEFYLVDFKKGVEFKCYAANRLPHARVVAIESDREFGLSVLQRVDEELKRRGDLFRKLGVQDVAGYKRAGGTESIPRSLLIVDEFQEFFVEDDRIAQTASLLLDRIVRQGRAFGIHVLLGSQTLGGAYTVARTTLGQMVIRIALQCNEADAYLIMDDTNPAPRLLSRPGEGIYNDTAGTLEGNSPFQVVWLPDEVRETYLEKVRAQADRDGKGYPGPIVFEGNAPADVRENPVLRNLLEADKIKRTTAARIWLGAPNSIKGPTEAAFHRQSGNNLLIVGQRDEAILAILGIGLISLAAQYPLGAARFILCDSTPLGTPPHAFLERILRAIPHPVTIAKQNDLGKILNDLAGEMKTRAEAADAAEAPATFLFIHGLQKYNKLRYEEEFGFAAPDADAPPNPAVLLNNLVCEGTRLGFHVIATCDTYNNVNRSLSRKAFSEFEMRVLFQMSANDSASLIDNPKASLLGLHRALFYNEQEGYLETFRPYALPSSEWIDQTARHLARLLR